MGSVLAPLPVGDARVGSYLSPSLWGGGGVRPSYPSPYEGGAGGGVRPPVPASYLSTSPKMMSKLPRITIASATLWPISSGFNAVRLMKLGARIFSR